MANKGGQYVKVGDKRIPRAEYEEKQKAKAEKAVPAKADSEVKDAVS
ncbi:hypothetical protein ABMA58_00180 [Oceanospirillum sp. HFRX-1_2]